MSSAKKRRDLNRAIEEHKTATLSAQLAMSNHTMLNIAESILAKNNESLRTQIAEQAAQIEMLRNALQYLLTEKIDYMVSNNLGNPSAEHGTILASKALSITPSQTLADFAAKVRKQCAVICDGLQHQRNKYIEEDGAEGKPFVPRDCAEAIRNLKELP